MNIIVKEVKDKNHVYLMDCNNRPLSINVVSKEETKNSIVELIKKNNILHISVMDLIDFSTNHDYFIDHI
jgi:hypothetical protein